MVNVTISLSLPDTVARDLTRIRQSIISGGTVVVGYVDSTSPSVTFRDINHITVGCQIFCPDNGEMMTVTALPTTLGGPCTVTRGDYGDTVIPAFPIAAASHADQQQVFILKLKGLVDMGSVASLGVIQDYIMSMGTGSETLGPALLTQAQAAAAFQAALDSVLG